MTHRVEQDGASVGGFHRQSFQRRTTNSTWSDHVKSERKDVHYTIDELQTIWGAVLQSVDMKLEPPEIESLAVTLGRAYASVQSKAEGLRANSNDPNFDTLERQTVIDAVHKQGQNLDLGRLAFELAIVLLRVPILVEQLIMEVSSASNIQVIPHRPRGVEEWSRIMNHQSGGDSGSDEAGTSSIRNNNASIIPSVEEEQSEAFIKFESEDERSFQSSTDYSTRHRYRPRSKKWPPSTINADHRAIADSETVAQSTATRVSANRPFTSPLSLKRKRAASRLTSRPQGKQQTPYSSMRMCNYCDVLSLHDLNHEETCPIQDEYLGEVDEMQPSPIITYHLHRTEWICLYRLNSTSLRLCMNALTSGQLVQPFCWNDLQAVLSIPRARSSSPQVKSSSQALKPLTEEKNSMEERSVEKGTRASARVSQTLRVMTTSPSTTLEQVEVKRRRGLHKREAWLPSMFRR